MAFPHGPTLCAAVLASGTVVNKVITAGAVQYQIWEDGEQVCWRPVCVAVSVRLAAAAVVSLHPFLQAYPRVFASVFVTLASTLPLSSLSVVCVRPLRMDVHTVFTGVRVRRVVQQFIASGNLDYFVCTNKGCDVTKPMALTLNDPTSLYSTYSVTITIPAPSPKSTVRRAALMLLMRCARRAVHRR